MLAMYMDLISLKQHPIICWHCRRLGLAYRRRDSSLQVNGVQNLWSPAVSLILHRLRVMRVFIIGLTLVLSWVARGWAGSAGVASAGVGSWGFIMFMKVIILNILLFPAPPKRARLIGSMPPDIPELALPRSPPLSIAKAIGLSIWASIVQRT